MFHLNQHFAYRFKFESVLLLLTILLVTAACTTVEPIQALGHTWRAYERTVRWGDVTGSVHYLKEDVAATAKFPKAIKDIKITGYNVIRESVNEDTMIATQVVTIRYYNVNNSIEKTLVDSQEWKYDGEKQRWYLTSDLIEFPGVK